MRPLEKTMTAPNFQSPSCEAAMGTMTSMRAKTGYKYMSPRSGAAMGRSSIAFGGVQLGFR